MSNSQTLQFPPVNPNSLLADITPFHIGIRTTAYTEMITWYRVKLDFRVVKEWEVGTMKLAFLAPASTNGFIIEIIGVSESDLKTNQSTEIGYHHICYQVNNLDAALEVLKSRDITIDRCFPVQIIGKRVAFITDPFGNTIEFCENI